MEVDVEKAPWPKSTVELTVEHLMRPRRLSITPGRRAEAPLEGWIHLHYSGLGSMRCGSRGKGIGSQWPLEHVPGEPYLCVLAAVLHWRRHAPVHGHTADIRSRAALASTFNLAQHALAPSPSAIVRAHASGSLQHSTQTASPRISQRCRPANAPPRPRARPPNDDPRARPPQPLPLLLHQPRLSPHPSRPSARQSQAAKRKASPPRSQRSTRPPNPRSRSSRPTRRHQMPSQP